MYSPRSTWTFNKTTHALYYPKEQTWCGIPMQRREQKRRKRKRALRDKFYKLVKDKQPRPITCMSCIALM